MSWMTFTVSPRLVRQALEEDRQLSVSFTPDGAYFRATLGPPEKKPEPQPIAIAKRA